MENYRRLLKYLRPYLWPYFALAIVCMASYSATTGSAPLLLRHVIDDIFTRRDQTALAYMPWIIVAVFTFRCLVHFAHSYLMDFIGLRILNDVRTALNSHMQYLSLSYFQRHPTGTLISRITNDVGLVRSALTDSVASVMRDSMSLIGLVAVAFYMDWVLASIAFVVFPASVLPITRMSKRIKRLTKRNQVSRGRLVTLLQESIQGNRIVKAFGMEQYEIDRFNAENNTILKQALKAVRTSGFVSPVMEMLAALAIAAVLWYGGYSVTSGGRTQGEFMAFLMAMFLLYQPFKALAKTYTVIQQGLAGAERIFEVLDTVPEVRN
ncbi:MAG: ABC transporter transmembrane domain-containing protein, partial [Gammaproteobacteria bacterium]